MTTILEFGFPSSLKRAFQCIRIISYKQYDMIGISFIIGVYIISPCYREMNNLLKHETCTSSTINVLVTDRCIASNSSTIWSTIFRSLYKSTSISNGNRLVFSRSGIVQGDDCHGGGRIITNNPRIDDGINIITRISLQTNLFSALGLFFFYELTQSLNFDGAHEFTIHNHRRLVSSFPDRKKR